MPTEALIRTDAVTVEYPVRGSAFRRQMLRAVDCVSLPIAAGETLALVGESGSGKSTLGRVLLGLQTPLEGVVVWRGHPVTGLRGREWREFRREVQVVFQDTGAALNPRRHVIDSVALPLRWNRGLRSGEAAERAAELLEQVGLPARDFARRLPHALSGGQRQRVGIARALASDPALVVADEPVSALDVSVRAQVLRVLQAAQRARGLAMLFITNDLGVVRAIADWVAVMQSGRIVEDGPTDAVLDFPRHPYTRALMAATPALPSHIRTT